jgi:hypothetical protein
VVEKPIVATLPQIEKLKTLLELPGAASRVLALDHWMARLETVQQGLVDTVADIVRIEGFLQEPSGYNAAGEPIALNFATGEPDTRTLRHPDGVILDIGTHVLAMLRETLRYLGECDMALQVVTAKDRLGRDIRKGDLTTAEGEAHLQGQISGVPVDIWLNKYAGPLAGKKGCGFICATGASSATTDAVQKMFWNILMARTFSAGTCPVPSTSTAWPGIFWGRKVCLNAIRKK